MAVTKKRVGILRGGKGRHYEKSLKDGGQIIARMAENLPDKYKAVDILIDRNSVWHLNGVPVKPVDLIHKVDVIWNTANPTNSRILENFGIPNISQNIFLRTLENNREMMHKHLKSIGVNMTRHLMGPKSPRAVLEKFGAPWIVRVGNEIEVVKTFDELVTIMSNVGNITVEEFILGKPGAVHTLAGFRGEDVYVLPPAGFTKSEKETITKFAKILHKHLNTGHYLKSDFVLHPKRGIFITNIYFTPDLRANSHLDQACQSVGTKLDNILEHIIESTL